MEQCQDCGSSADMEYLRLAEDGYTTECVPLCFQCADSRLYKEENYCPFCIDDSKSCNACDDSYEEN